MAGARTLGEPADLLARSPDALAGLVEEVARAKLPLLLLRIPAQSPTIEALRATFSRARIQSTEAASNPTIELSERWAEPGGGLSSSRRSALRRSRRKAEKYGEVEVELLSPVPAEVGPLLDQAFAIEARSWKGAEGTAVAAVPKMDAFFRCYATELATRGCLRVEFLRIGGRRVAMQLGAAWNDRHWLFKIGYDAAYAAGSPGQVLLAESVAAAARDGMTSYELLGSREAWTDVWTELNQPCVKVTVLPHSGRGMIAVGSVRWQAAEKRLERGLRRGKLTVAQAAGERYVAGPELADALAEGGRYADAGYATTVGFWNGSADPPDRVAAEGLATAEALPAGSEVSIKPVPMGGDGPALDRLLDACTEHELTLHLDAQGPESATESQHAAVRLAASAPGRVGCTLPGRWSRSVADAEALAGTGTRVRVVKGEVADRAGLEVDPRAGFIAVVEALAAHRSCHVEVATHDAVLAGTCLKRLLAAGASCELQVLHAMRSAAAIRIARKLGVPVRVYVPYGTGRAPYAPAALRRHPALAMSFARDVLPGPTRRPALLVAKFSELLDFLPL